MIRILQNKQSKIHHSERAFEQKAIPAGCQNRRTNSAGSRYSLLPLKTNRPSTDTANA